MYQTATPAEIERPRYRWCSYCEQLWVANRFGATCPLCGALTFAYVGRDPYDDAPHQQRRALALKRGLNLVEAAVINSVTLGAHHVRHRLFEPNRRQP